MQRPTHPPQGGQHTACFAGILRHFPAQRRSSREAGGHTMSVLALRPQALSNPTQCLSNAPRPP